MAGEEAPDIRKVADAILDRGEAKPSKVGIQRKECRRLTFMRLRQFFRWFSVLVGLRPHATRITVAFV